MTDQQGRAWLVTKLKALSTERLDDLGGYVGCYRQDRNHRLGLPRILDTISPPAAPADREVACES
jgi:hypothetical protein